MFENNINFLRQLKRKVGEREARVPSVENNLKASTYLNMDMCTMHSTTQATPEHRLKGILLSRAARLLLSLWLSLEEGRNCYSMDF